MTWNSSWSSSLSCNPVSPRHTQPPSQILLACLPQQSSFPPPAPQPCGPGHAPSSPWATLSPGWSPEHKTQEGCEGPSEAPSSPPCASRGEGEGRQGAPGPPGPTSGSQGSAAAWWIRQQLGLGLSCPGAGRDPRWGCVSPMSLMATSRKGCSGLLRYSRLWCRCSSSLVLSPMSWREHKGQGWHRPSPPPRTGLPCLPLSRHPGRPASGWLVLGCGGSRGQGAPRGTAAPPCHQGPARQGLHQHPRAAAAGRGTAATPREEHWGKRGSSRLGAGLWGHPHQALADPPGLLCLQQLLELLVLQELGTFVEGAPRGLQSSKDQEMAPLPRVQGLGVPGQSRGEARSGGPNSGLRHLQAPLGRPWGLRALGLCGHALLLPSSAGLGRAGVGIAPAHLLSCCQLRGCRQGGAPSPPQGLRRLGPNWGTFRGLRDPHLSHVVVLVMQVEEERHQALLHILPHLLCVGADCNLHCIPAEEDGELSHAAGLLGGEKKGGRTSVLAPPSPW